MSKENRRARREMRREVRNSRRPYDPAPSGNEGSDDILLIGIGALIVLGLVLAALGWLDSVFGWGLLPVVKGWLGIG